MEDEVRAAPPRRINRDRETRPLSLPSAPPLARSRLYSHPSIAAPSRTTPPASLQRLDIPLSSASSLALANLHPLPPRG